MNCLTKHIKITVASLVLLVTSSNANAWGQMGIPDPVTWVIHAGLGFGIAWYMDTHTNTSDAAGVGVATAVGVLKEVSDINFSVPDAASWGFGAAFYHYQKQFVVVCPEIKSELHQDDWYVVRKERKLEDCPK